MAILGGCEAFKVGRRLGAKRVISEEFPVILEYAYRAREY